MWLLVRWWIRHRVVVDVLLVSIDIAAPRRVIVVVVVAARRTTGTGLRSSHLTKQIQRWIWMGRLWLDGNQSILLVKPLMLERASQIGMSLNFRTIRNSTIKNLFCWHDSKTLSL